MASLVLANILCILLAGGLRYGPGAVLAGAPRWLWLAVVIAATGALVVALSRDFRRGQAPWSCRVRLLLWLVFPGAAALNWTVGSRGQVAGADLPALTFLFGLVIAVLAQRWPEWGGRESRPVAWAVAARWVLAPTVVVVGIGVARGITPESDGTALATYPLFALIQLGAALVLPATQWTRDRVSRTGQVVGSTLLFALAHWPNPFATLATAAGMLVWALAWQRGSALVPLALSMGLCATVVTQALPDSFTGHMRVGASYASHALEARHKEELHARSAAIEAAIPWTDSTVLADWVAEVFTTVSGETPSPEYAHGVADLLARMHREQMVRWVFDSPEFRKRHDAGDPLSAADMAFFDTTFVPFLDAHAPYARLVSEGQEIDYREFTALVYRTLLGREPGPTEYRYWPRPLTARVRTAFIRRVLRGEEESEARRRWNDPEPEELLTERKASSP